MIMSPTAISCNDGRIPLWVPGICVYYYNMYFLYNNYCGQCGYCKRRTWSVAVRSFPDDKAHVKCCFECANKPDCKHGNKMEYEVPEVSGELHINYS